MEIASCIAQFQMMGILRIKELVADYPNEDDSHSIL